MGAISDSAIVLRRWEWSETSQIVALSCRDHGLMRGLAKGARRERAAYSGGFEPLTLGSVLVYPRRNSSLATLAEWDLQEVFWGPRRSLQAHYMGLYTADLALHMMAEDDPHPALWDAHLHALRSLEGSEPDGIVLLRFQWTVLVESGHRLDLRGPDCAGESDEPIGLDLDGGRLIADPGNGSDARFVWRVRSGTVDLLRQIDGGSENGLRGEAPTTTIERANRLLGAYCARLAGRAPPSAKLALRIGDQATPES